MGTDAGWIVSVDLQTSNTFPSVTELRPDELAKATLTELGIEGAVLSSNGSYIKLAVTFDPSLVTENEHDRAMELTVEAIPRLQRAGFLTDRIDGFGGIDALWTRDDGAR